MEEKNMSAELDRMAGEIEKAMENAKILERETKVAKASAAADILLDMRNRVEHERRMIEAYAHDLEVDYLTSEEKKRSARQLLERQEKVELLDAICNFIVERGI